MDIGNIGMIGQIKGRMKWHHARQNVLAQNVANVDTPGYRGRDFKPHSADSPLDRQLGMKPVRTNSGHLQISGTFLDGPRAAKASGYETTPYKNSVTAEQEMLKVTQNQLDYQIATTVYQRNIGLIKMAVRR
ncbi:MAG: flagellar basal body rod protein FlgB [Pseudomonadota bacterium]